MTIIKALPGVIMLLVLSSGCQQEVEEEEALPRPVRMMSVGDVTAIQGRRFPGRAAAAQELNLSFRVRGPLVTLPIQVGNEVKKGELLARIDPRDYKTRLRSAQAEIQRANAAKERAANDFRRILEIQRRDATLVSEANVDRAREADALAAADVVAMEASVDGAEDELADTYLRAPFDGIIVAVEVDNHEYVQAQQPITRLLDKSRVEFLVNIPESLISLVHRITGLQVSFDAFPGLALKAEIQEIGSEASSVTRTFPVTLIMDQPEDVVILPGMAGSVTSPTSSDADASGEAIMVVPVYAVLSPTDSTQSYVWVIRSPDDTVELRPVETGKLGNLGVTILSGLERGERIATAGIHFLREGQRVRPLAD